MADEKREDQIQQAVDKLNKASKEKLSQPDQEGKKSNEVTERDRVKDPGYVHRIEEKTEKH
jgi:hypothetical protein